MAGSGFQLFHYHPSLAAAVIFVVLFAGTTCLHLFQLIKKRTWYFIPFVIGGIFETIGYVARTVCSEQTPDWTLGPYICQSLLVLVAPALYAASIYMIIGRLIRLINGESYSIIRTTWLTKFFVAGDVLSFFTQGGGGGLLAKANTDSQRKLGQNIIVAGLFIQVIFFAFFIIVVAIFHRRISRAPTAKSASVEVNWKQYIIILYVASVLIGVRSLFRIIEYLQGNDGFLLRHEYFLYIFDAVLMWIMMVIFNVWHPSKIISKDRVTRRLNMDNELDIENR